MKVLTLTSSNDIWLKDSAEPDISNNEILIKLESCGICGSDLGNIFGNSCKPTTKIGHEIAGTIEKVGSAINGRYKRGQRVFVNHHAPCSSCHYCLHGNETMCEKFVDSIRPCGISEKIAIPEWIINNNCVFILPDSLSFEEGSMIEPLACCIRGWKKITFDKNDNIAIFGMGPIGMLHAKLAKVKGAKKIFCIDINKHRIDFCKNFGLGNGINFFDPDINKIIFSSTMIGVDSVIISTSDMRVLNKAIQIIRKGGTILIFGEPQKGEKINLDLSEIYSKELTIKTTYAATSDNIVEAINILENKITDVNKLITHRFSIDKSREAIEKVHKKEDIIKAMIINKTD